MLQSYLVTNRDNKRLNLDTDIFRCLVAILDCSIARTFWNNFNFAVIEVVKV